MSTYGQEGFIRWLKKRGLSDSSISKYSKQANNRIIQDLGISFYSVEKIDDLSQLLTDVKLLESLMPKDPKRMYSAAVSNYIKYRVEAIDIENTVKDSYYGYEVEKIIIEEENKSFNLNPQSALTKKELFQYQRDPKVGARALISADYQCKINNKHRFFTSRRTKRNYVEAHHLIPIAYQSLFENGIDIVDNIVSLCPVCHKCIHYGENSARVEMIHTLYQGFQFNLRKSAIEIREKELLELYQIY